MTRLRTVLCERVVEREDRCGARVIYTGVLFFEGEFICVQVRCPIGHVATLRKRLSDNWH